MIELLGVHKSFEGLSVLRGVDLCVPSRSTFALLGASGSGKTVLLKLVMGLLRPDAGVVKVDGEDLARLSGRALDGVRRKLGILFQSSALFDSMTVAENLALPLEERLHLPGEERRRRIGEVLGLLDLAGTEGLTVAELSGGMRKRVAFARAVVLEPEIYLLDEPTAGLDPLTTRAVSDEILLASRKLQATILAITHDLPTAFRVADRIGLLHDGVIVGAGTPGEFARSPHPAVHAFLRTWRAQGHAAPPAMA